MEANATKTNKQLKKELIDLVLKRSGTSKKELLDFAIDNFLTINAASYLTTKEKEYFKSVFICRK